MAERIDLSAQINEIRARFPDCYWRSSEALAEIAALWGGGPINPHGVFENAESLRFTTNGPGHAEIRLARALNGRWAMSISYLLPVSGYSSAPSVWNRAAYTSRDAAIAAGIRELTAQLER